jgi:hypothetical protein
MRALKPKRGEKLMGFYAQIADYKRTERKLYSEMDVGK